MTGFLIFLIIALVLVALFQVTKTLDLVSELRADDKEEERHADFHGKLMLLFLVAGMFGFFWCFGAYNSKLFPKAASEHGILLDNLFFWTLLITGVVFILTNIALFVFAYIYRWRNDGKAEHIAHNNMLEFIWTAVPAVVLTFLVVLGLRAWNEITGEPSEDAYVFEMTGQQFFWSSRFPGADGELGIKDYNLISAENPLGVVLPEFIDHKRVDILNQLADLEEYNNSLPQLIEDTEYFIEHHPNPIPVDSAKKTLKKYYKDVKEIPAKQKRVRAHYRRILKKFTPEYLADAEVAPLIQAGYDDFQPSEVHLPVDRECMVRITSKDVLHNFYIPYLSVKMDAVPGIPTRFKFVPKVTTEDMRERIADNKEWQVVDEGADEPRWKSFVYEIACAELCGKGHNSMRYVLDIDTEQDFNTWLTEQTPLFDLQKESLAKLSEAEYSRLEEMYVNVDVDHHGGHGGHGGHGDDHGSDHDEDHDDHGDEDGHADGGHALLKVNN